MEAFDPPGDGRSHAVAGAPSNHEAARVLADPRTAAFAADHLGRLLLGRYTRQVILPNDVARLVDDGLLHFFGAGAPQARAATVVDAAAAGASSGSPGELFERLEAELLRRRPWTWGVVAIDALDAVAAATARTHEEALAAADAAHRLLRRASRAPGPTESATLHLPVPARVAAGLSVGPLFPVAPLDWQHAAAAGFALALVERVERDDALVGRVLLDVVVAGGSAGFDPADAPGTAAADGLQRLLTATPAVVGGPVRFVFEGADPPLVDGLTWSPPGEGPVDVQQYVGLHLPSVWRRLGVDASETKLLDEVGALCEAMVRGAEPWKSFQEAVDAEEGGSSGREPSRRARVVGVPIGLDRVVAEIVGRPLATDD
ncbi:MAG: hypothetical protein ACRDD1_06160, partial [Planctomycetia bacterium]